MQEMTIDGQVYQFNFGMGFLREINKKISAPVDGAPGTTQNVGLRFYTLRLIDGDVESLIDVLDTANKGQNPRLSRTALDAFVDDEGTDIEEVFDEVMGFLQTTNSTKKVVLSIQEMVERQKQKQNQ